MNIANNWKDYKILDMADGQKLERWGEVILSRPDPQIIWKQKSYSQKWKNINATYHRSKTGGGAWEYNKKMPFISYGGTSVAILLAEMGMVLSVSNQIIYEK